MASELDSTNGRNKETPMELVNTSDETANTQCDGCPGFEILTRRIHAKETTVYYCNPKRCYINPFDVSECSMNASKRKGK